MDIKVIGDDNKEISKPQETIAGQLVGDVAGDLEIKSIGQVMGLERDSELGQNHSKLQTLLDYAKTQTEDYSLENLKWIIRSLELKLGTPPLAEKRINYVTRYAYLLTREAEIKKEKEKFERG